MSDLLAGARRLARSGDEVRRTTRAPDRHRAWQRWAEELRALIDQNPQLQAAGIALRWETLAPDLHALHRFIAGQVEGKDSAATEAQAPTRQSPAAVVGSKAGAQVRVFLSYRHEEQVVARRFADLLTRLYEDSVSAFYSMRDMDPGNYKLQLNREIAAADWFVLLFTDPDQDWQWPIAEAARFEAVQYMGRNSDRDGPFRLCVLHATEEKPKPLQDYQSYYASVPAMMGTEERDEFAFYEASQIHMFFRKFNEYVTGKPEEQMSSERRKLLIEATRDLCKAFDAARSDRVIDTQYFVARAEISIHGPRAGDSVDWTAVSVRLGDRAREIFGLHGRAAEDGQPTRHNGRQSISWADFSRYAREGEGAQRPQWLDQMEQALIAAEYERTHEPVSALIASRRHKRHFRPVLSRRELSVDGSRRFFVLFVEQLPFDFRSHQQFGVLMAALLLGSRFRFEVLGESVRRLRRAASLDAIKRTTSETRSQIETMECEAARHGLMEDYALADCFSGDDRDAIVWAFEEWHRHRIQLFSYFAATEGADELSEARATSSKLIALLTETLKPVNSKVLELCVRKYHDLMIEEVGRARPESGQQTRGGNGEDRLPGRSPRPGAQGRPARRGASRRKRAS